MCLIHTFTFDLHQLLIFSCNKNVFYTFSTFLFLFPHFVVHQESKEQLSPLSAALAKLQQEKQELLERKRQKQEEGQEKVATFSHSSPFEWALLRKQHSF